MILDRSNKSCWICKKVKARISSTKTKRNIANFQIFRNLIKKLKHVPELEHDGKISKYESN